MRSKGLMLPIIAFAALAVCLPTAVRAQTGQPLWDKIQSSGELVCGAMAANPLGSWKVGPDHYEGYEINFCRRIAQDLGAAMGKPIALRFHEITWSTVVLELQSGRIDLFPSMSVTDERKQALDMTEPVLMLDECVIGRHGTPARTEWQQYSDPAMRIATVMGTSDSQAVHDLAPKATVLSFKELSDASLAMQAGRADALGTSILICLDMAKRAPEAFGDIAVPKPGRPLPSSAGLRRDGDRRFFRWLNEWVVKARSTGLNRDLLIDAMKKGGLDSAKLPPGVTF
jgi:polar amino acid transport system substrate-binding protein